MTKEERIQYVLDNIKDNTAVNISLSLVNEWLNEEITLLEHTPKKIENLIIDNGVSVVNVAYKLNEIIDYINKGDE